MATLWLKDLAQSRWGSCYAQSSVLHRNHLLIWVADALCVFSARFGEGNDSPIRDMRDLLFQHTRARKLQLPPVRHSASAHKTRLKAERAQSINALRNATCVRDPHHLGASSRARGDDIDMMNTQNTQYTLVFSVRILFDIFRVFKQLMPKETNSSHARENVYAIWTVHAWIYADNIHTTHTERHNITHCTLKHARNTSEMGMQIWARYLLRCGLRAAATAV